MLTRNRQAVAAALVLLSALSLGTAGSLAQSSQQPAAAAEIQKEELQAFATASLEVRDISHRLRASMEAAESDSEQQAVRERAMAEMREAVQETGLTVDRYNEIYEVARANPEVATQIQEYQSRMN